MNIPSTFDYVHFLPSVEQRHSDIWLHHTHTYICIYGV